MAEEELEQKLQEKRQIPANHQRETAPGLSGQMFPDVARQLHYLTGKMMTWSEI